MLITGKPRYFQEDYEYWGIKSSKPTSTPGSSSLKRRLDGDEAASPMDHKQFMKTAGKLQWIVPIRPEIAYAVKELARALQGPTYEDLACLRHLLKYMEGTEDYQFLLEPKVMLPEKLRKTEMIIEVDAYVDSDWAGCGRTRKSTNWPPGVPPMPSSRKD